MGDSTRSTTPTRTPVTHYYSVLGIPKTASLKEISKAYKSLVMKWHPDRNTSNRAEAEDKFTTINEAYRVLSSNKKEEANKCIPKTPKKIKHRHKDEIIISNPTLLSSTSTRVTPRSTTPTPSEYSEHSEFSDFSKCSTRRSKTPTPSSSSADFLASSSINLGGPTTQEAAILSKMASRRGSAPIFYSHSTSTTRRKPPPVEKKLRCTLEELCHGCVKKIKITRNTFSPFGAIVEEEEMLTIKVKPGWKKGTKVTFEGKGDEQPGTLPADIIFVIDEKRHHLFKRDGDNLDLGVEVPLVQALTGCTITVPLLGGGEMNLSFEDILYPGYEKIIPGEGMPKPKEAGKRGDLRLRFLVEFPKGLSDEQRADIVKILEEEEEEEES